MEDLKQMRLDLDGISQLVNTTLFPYEVNRYDRDDLRSLSHIKTEELKNVSKSILLGKAWIGKLMGELGGTSPYTNDGKRNDVGDIEPIDAQAIPDPRGTAIQAFLSDSKEIWSSKNHVQKIDALRGVIDWVLDKFIKAYATNQSITIAIIFQHITEAKLWLGFELGRCRDEEQARIDIEVKKMEARESQIEMTDGELGEALN